MQLPRPEHLGTFRVTFHDGEQFDVVAEDIEFARRSAKALRPFSQIKRIVEWTDKMMPKHLR